MSPSSPPLSSCPIVILAGGRSSRFGAPKALAKLGDRSLLEHVVCRLAAQTSAGVVLNAARGSFDQVYRGEYIEDALDGGLGPLSGLHAGLLWAQSKGHDAIMTAPVDTPFLPHDLAARLAQTGAPACAASMGRRHPVVGLWPVDLLNRLTTEIENGLRAANAWARICSARTTDFPTTDGIDPFFNINTQADHEKAVSLLPTS